MVHAKLEQCKLKGGAFGTHCLSKHPCTNKISMTDQQINLELQKRETHEEHFQGLRTCQGKWLVLCHRLLLCHTTAREGDKRQYMSPFFLVPSVNIRGNLKLMWRQARKLFQTGKCGNVDCHCDHYIDIYRLYCIVMYCFIVKHSVSICFLPPWQSCDLFAAPPGPVAGPRSCRPNISSTSIFWPKSPKIDSLNDCFNLPEFKVTFLLNALLRLGSPQMSR